MTEREFTSRLSKRARRVSVPLSPELSQKLWVYFELLAKWNAKINLSGHDLAEPTQEAIDRLLVEPLMAARYAEPGASVIDIGSGGGSPALPFMLALGLGRVTMVEVKTRKSVFLREAIRELGLIGSEVLTARHEALLSHPTLHDAFDLLTVRAVRVESRVLSELQAFVKPDGAVFHFRATSEAHPVLPPVLTHEASHPLLEARGELAILRKRPKVSRTSVTVPRGTLS